MVGYKGNLDDPTYQIMVRELVKIINEYADNEKVVCDIGCYDDYLVDKVKYKKYYLVDREFIKEELRFFDKKNEYNLIYIEKDINDFLDFAIKSELYFDVVIINSLVEHLTINERDNAFYKIRKILKDSGVLILSYPNCKSLNRLLGVEMGIIPDPTALDEGDKRVEHKIMYDWKALRHFEQYLRMKLIREDGIMFKPLPNSMMVKYFGHELDLFVEIGKQIGPPYCGLLLGVYKKIF
jgi:SAM-dependent methyltransferase